MWRMWPTPFPPVLKGVLSWRPSVKDTHSSQPLQFQRELYCLVYANTDWSRLPGFSVLLKSDYNNTYFTSVCLAESQWVFEAENGVSTTCGEATQLAYHTEVSMHDFLLMQSLSDTFPSLILVLTCVGVVLYLNILLPPYRTDCLQ